MSIEMTTYQLTNRRPSRQQRKNKFFAYACSLYVVFLLCAALPISGFAQTVSGPTCPTISTQYTYTFGGSPTMTTNFTWTVTGGTITSGGSGVGFSHMSIGVTFTSLGAGKVSVSTSNAGSAFINVTVISAYFGGTASPATQSIIYNAIPTDISCTAATGAYCGPTYQYQWQSSTDNVNFLPVSGATGQNLSLSTTHLTQTTYYRRMVTETHTSSVTYSNTSTVIVYPQLLGGVIAGTTTINYNTTPPAFTSTTAASGGACSAGVGTLAYLWQQSTDNITFTDMTAYTGLTFAPGQLTQTKYYRRKVTCNTEVAYSNTLTVTVNPAVYPGTIAQVSLNVATNTSPGALVADPAAGGQCSNNYLYQWQSSPTNTTFTDISGATSLYYTPGNLTATMYYRRKVTCGTDIEYSNVCQVLVNTPLSLLNYIRMRDITIPAITTSTAAAALTNPTDVKQSTQYFDGLGRAIQTVSRQASPLLKDIVSVNEYDLASREIVKYLPYVSTTTDGNNKSYPVSDLVTFNGTQFSGENYYMSYAVPENSPLGRSFVNYAPGLSWVGQTRGVSSSSMVNDVSEGVRIWTIAAAAGSLPASTSAYASGLLYKSITIDEQNHQTIEYKDKEGHTILKKVQLAASPGVDHTGWLCTYYVYDDLGNLRFVLQPRAVELISATWVLTQAIADELCFRYEYDARRNMNIKKVPGAGEVWMIYDQLDRLVLTQDASLRTTNQWMYTKYDGLNRVIMTGLYTNTTQVTQATMQSFLNSQNLGRFETYQTAALPLYSLNLTFPVVSTYLVVNYYDDYSWASFYGPFGFKDNTYDVNFAAASNSVYPYPQAITWCQQSRSKLTTTWTANGNVVYYYDDRGRVIQTKGFNHSGGMDILTSQYNFAGKPLQTYMRHQKNAPNAQIHTVSTKMDYDAAFRLLHIWKNIDAAGSDQLIATNTYNELGQLQNKQLGNNLENLAYEYNIRGWLKTINKNYVSGTVSTNYFGMELGYDKTASVNTTTSYTTAAYNGNITGTVWRSSGDGVGRKYDFVYDNVNRLTAGNFVQNTSGSAWDNGYIDFSATGLSYDANGNILTMNQKGFKVGGSALIDQLTYTYLTNSNKLSIVTDGANDPNSKLGDFHYNGKHTTDYGYYPNGNLATDDNKIIQFTYNFLNLPTQVTATGKGTISYLYDPLGNKLTKTTVDNIAVPSKTTTTMYIKEFVYTNDTLQFIGTEEGRARWAYHKYLNGSTAYKFEYDYFVKDHLGNTRVVLTQQKDTAQYLATMEAAYRATETQLFNNITNTSYRRSLVSGYPNDISVTNPNDSVAKVNGSGQKTGPSILLKVMSGDKIDIAVQSYYNTGTNTTQNSSVTDVLNSLANGIVTMAGGSKGSVADLNNTGASPIYAALNSFMTGNDPNPSGKPKAYLNWILLDEQLKYVSSYPQSGAVVVGAAATLNTLGYTGLPITKNGYLYIWVSNETTGWDVFFDNLSIKHYTGPLLEETHYYPFGLTMSGISSKALKPNYAENKYRFQKQELQNKEFSDGSGLEMYEFKYRMDDPQTGRFWSIDPLSEKYVYNSPYAFSENKVTGHIELEGLESAPATGNDVNNPYIRAALKENVSKDIQNYKTHLSGAVEVKGSVGVGVGGGVKVAGVDLSGAINGPQAEVKVNGAGKVDGGAAVMGVGGKAETPFGSVKGGANFGVVDYKDGQISGQVATGTMTAGTGKAKEIKSTDKSTSGNIGTNIATAAVSVSAKFGLVGFQITVNVVDGAKSVGDFFKTIVDYVKNVADEKISQFRRR